MQWKNIICNICNGFIIVSVNKIEMQNSNRMKTTVNRATFLIPKFVVASGG